MNVLKKKKLLQFIHWLHLPGQSRIQFNSLAPHGTTNHFKISKQVHKFIIFCNKFQLFSIFFSYLYIFPFETISPLRNNLSPAIHNRWCLTISSHTIPLVTLATPLSGGERKYPTLFRINYIANRIRSRNRKGSKNLSWTMKSCH